MPPVEPDTPPVPTGTLPLGPLHRGLPPYTVKTKGSVETVLIDVKQVVDPSVEFQITCETGEKLGEFKFVVPPGIDAGMYEFSARLVQPNDPAEGTIPEQEIEVV